MADEKPVEQQSGAPAAAPAADAPPAAPVVDSGAAAAAPVADAAASGAPPVADAPVQVADAPPVVADAPPAEKPADAPTDLLRSAKTDAEKIAEANKPAAEGDKPADGDKPPAEVKAEEKPADAPAEKPAEEKKPAEGEKPAEEKKDEAPAEAAKAPPLEYKYELPERITLNDEQRTELHAAVDEYRANPADLTPLLNQATKLLDNFATYTLQNQIDVFNQTKDGWLKDSMADEQVGGSAWKTTEGRVAEMRDMFVSRHAKDSPGYIADWNEFNQLMDYTGLGNNRVMLKLFDNIARVFKERGAPEIVDAKPAPDAHRRKGAAVLYNNPRSEGMNGGG